MVSYPPLKTPRGRLAGLCESEVIREIRTTKKIILATLILVVSLTSTVYAVGLPVFHMSHFVHNWRGDIAVAEPVVDTEVIEEVLVDEGPEPTEEIRVDEDPEPTQEPQLEEPISTEMPLVDEAPVEELSIVEPEAEETLFAEVEQITPEPITEDITEEITAEEQIEKQNTEGDEEIDQNTHSMEPEG